MTLLRTPLALGAASAALLLGACATPAPEKTRAAALGAPAAAVADAAPSATAAAPAAPAATTESRVASVELAGNRGVAADPAAGKARPYVYFDFDSAVVRNEFNESIDAHARQLLAMSDKRLRIEGHTDERGGREYNLALGQRRAEAVAQKLQLLGVPTGRLDVVSYGEERPKSEGSDEEAWAKNRRAALLSERGERVAQAAAPR